MPKLFVTPFLDPHTALLSIRIHQNDLSFSPFWPNILRHVLWYTAFYANNHKMWNLNVNVQVDIVEQWELVIGSSHASWKKFGHYRPFFIWYHWDDLAILNHTITWTPWYLILCIKYTVIFSHNQAFPLGFIQSSTHIPDQFFLSFTPGATYWPDS